MGDHRVYRDHHYELGTQLLLLRTRVALTQIALAEQLGVHRRSVQNWETGISYPKAETLQRLIAIFLQHHAFTPGNEHTEAHALWNQATKERPQSIPAFDETWFTQTLASNTAPPTTVAPPAVREHASSVEPARTPPPAPSQEIMDWGEAIAVPTLYGRDTELATLYQWAVEDRCRVVTIIGIGGLGKSSLAITFAQQALPQFEVVLFRSLQNLPPIAELLDQILRSVSDQLAPLPDQVSDKITLLVQRFRERRCLLVLDNLESIMQPGALTGTYRSGYAEYGTLLHALAERAHQSCLMLTSREKPAELGRLEGRAAAVRSLTLGGLDENACRIILAAKEISGADEDLGALTRLYGGNPLALQLVAEPIRELFGGDTSAFLAAGDAFFNGVGKLLEQQFARSTALEQAILYWLAIERELVPFSAVLTNLSEGMSQRDLLGALESLRHRMLIERAADRPAFTLQPVILEFVTNQLVGDISQELADGAPRLLQRHALVQATAKNYVRLSQERLIATPVLERLAVALGRAEAIERKLLALLDSWRGQPAVAQGYGPGNLVNLLRLLRGDLNGLDLSQLVLQHVYLQGVTAHDASLAGSHLIRSVFQEPFGGIESVACSPDMRYLAIGTVTGEVRLWDLADRTILLAVQGHTGPVVGLALSADGRLLASGSGDGTARLWDVPSGTNLAAFDGHTSVVWSVALSADGLLLASGSGDGTVRLWDVRSRVGLAVLEGHTSAVRGIALSADGLLLASGSYDGTVRLWDVAAALSATTLGSSCLAVLSDHTAGVYGVALSADGQMLASGSADHTVRLWDTSALLGGAGQSPPCLAILEGHTDAIRSVVLSPDGRLLASGSGHGNIRLWDVPSRAHLTTLEGHTNAIMSMAISADGQQLASGSSDGTVRLWDVRSRAVLAIIAGQTNTIMSVALASNGLLLASGSTDGTVRLWDAHSGKNLATLRGHTNMVMSAAFSLNDQLLATGSADGTIRLWDVRSGKHLITLEGHTNVVREIAWSADGRLLASGSYDGTVRLWDTSALRPDAGPAARFPSLPIGSAAARSLTTIYSHTEMIMTVAFALDGRLLASGSSDGTIRLWDTSAALSPGAPSPACLAVLQDHTSAVYKVVLSTDGRLLASSGFDRTVRLWELPDVLHADRPSPSSLAIIKQHPSALWSMALSKDARQLVLGDSAGTIEQWDVPSRTRVAILRGHTSAIWGVALSADRQLLVSGGTDGTVRLWDGLRATPLRTLQPDRAYERMDISDIIGVTDAQRASLLALGARDPLFEQPPVIDTPALPADDRQHRDHDLNIAIGLPFQLTTFIGRSHDLTEIANMLGDPACRLLTLLGPGGIGKTRLAIEIATRHTATFADGVAFVALAAVGTPSRIVSAIGDTLALAFAEHPDPSADLVGYLRGRHMLLILDNFEHLLAGAELIATILAHAPRVTILITSRERLNLQAEWLYDVEGLIYPLDEPLEEDLPHSLAALTDYSAVQLFVQRATQVLPGFALSEATIAAIVRICQHVAGMPLAIELAAAGVRIMPIAEIERQISANLNLLATTQRDVPARHRSMRAVFDHSWELLSEPEQTLFRRLAIFRNGFTHAAAEAVCTQGKGQKVEGKADSDEPLLPFTFSLLPLLAALVDKSLVRYESDSAMQSLAERAAPNAEDTPRFFMLEPIREYALGRLAASPDADDIRRRHAHYFAALAESALANWRSPMIEAAVAQQRREHDNMRAALQWAYDTGAGLIGLQLAEALWAFWRSYGYLSEGRAWLDQLLAIDETPTDRAAMVARQRGLHAAAWLASDQHDYTQAARLFEQSMALRRALGETEGDTAVKLNAARQARANGQYQRATALLEDALAQHRAVGDHTATERAEHGLSYDEFGQVLRELGLVLREQGNFTRATALFEEGLALHRAIGDRASEAFSLLGIGDVARDQGDGPAVRKYVEPSLAILRDLGMQWAIGFALNTLALGAFYEGKLTLGSTMIHESVALFRELKADGSEAEVLITLGKIMRAQGDVAAAYGALTKSLRLALAVGPRVMVAAALEEFACVVATQGHAGLTVRLLAAASALRVEMGTPTPPAVQHTLDHALSTARAMLGSETFAAMWAAGELPLEQVLSSIPGAAAL